MNSRAELITRELERVDGQPLSAGIGKHRKMASSPFVFYRGSAQLFYADIASGVLKLPQALNQLPLTCVMGDCHTSNFGFLTEEGSHGDTVIFSPNDFDDACVGHGAWDLMRFTVSLVLCAKHCAGLSAGKYIENENLVGKAFVDNAQITLAIHAFLFGYRSICELGASGVDHTSMRLNDIELPASLKKRYNKAVKRAAGGEDFESKSALAKAINLSSGSPRLSRIKDRQKSVNSQLHLDLSCQFAPYMDDAILDVVERIGAGTGSVNMSRYYFLVGPENYSGSADLPLCHLVEVKQQREASALHYFRNMSANNQLNPAHLTVACQRRMQHKPDLILDEVEWQDAHWLVRSRHHAKVGIDPEHIGLGRRNTEQNGFVDFARACGKALALAHCRSDRRSVKFEQAVCEILPQVNEEVVEQSFGYAQQVIRDQNWLATLFRTGQDV